MQWFDGLKIKTKVITCFIISALFTVIIGFETIEDFHNSRQLTSMITIAIAVVLLNIFIGVFLANNIGRALNKLINSANKIASGDFDVDINNKSSDEIGALMEIFLKMASNIRNQADEVKKIEAGDLDIQISIKSDKDVISKGLNRILGNLRSLMDEMNNMSKNHDAGDIDVFASEDKFQGAYKTMLQDVNNMVKGHIDVKKKTMACVAEFVKGNFDVELEKFPRKEAFINENIEMLRRNVKCFNAEINNMYKEHDAGDIDVFALEDKFQGAYKTMLQDVNNMVKGHIDIEKKTMTCVEEFAKGNFDAELEKFPSKKAFINDNIESLRKNLKNVNDEVTKVIAACSDGNLAERVDIKVFQGDWVKLMNGLNELIEVIVSPLNESLQVLGRMTLNDYTQEMTGQYNGDLKKLSESINLVRTRLLTIEDGFERLSKGDLSKLEQLDKLGKRSANDRMQPAMTAAMRSIQELIEEGGKLASAAINGDLSIRGNENKFEGGYKEVIKGMNQTMEAIVKPIMEAATVMEEISKGNLTVEMNDDYKGDYAKIKDSLKLIISSFNDVLKDINNAAG
jgi:methyl-accepting chemotaxis protein